MKGSVEERDAPSLTAPRSRRRSHRSAFVLNAAKQTIRFIWNNVQAAPNHSKMFLQQAANKELRAAFSRPEVVHPAKAAHVESSVEANAGQV